MKTNTIGDTTEGVEVVNTDQAGEQVGDTTGVVQAVEGEKPAIATKPPRVKSTKTKADYNRTWYAKHGKEYANRYYAEHKDTILAARRAKTAAAREERLAARAQAEAEAAAAQQASAQ